MDDEVEERLLAWLDKIWHELLHLLKPTVGTRITLSTKEGIMANYQLNAGDSVVVTITDADAVTGAAVAVDAGSVTVVLSSTTDTIVANADGTYTITAGTTTGTGNTVTVNATVGRVASKAFVGTYDVVGATAGGNPTTLSATFGTESGPTGSGLNPPLTAAQSAALVAAGVPYPGAPAGPLTAAQSAALVAAGIPWTGTTGGTPGPLTAAQSAALVAAGIPFTAFPLTAAQTAALVAAGVPSPTFTSSVIAGPTVGNAVGEISPTTGLLNT